MSDYSEKLRDPRWQRRRLEVFQRANFECWSCGAKDKTLHVHHLIYRKGLDPWEYGDDDLRCFCETCHQENHRLKAMLDETLAELGSVDEVLGYAQTIAAISSFQYDAGDSVLVVQSYSFAEGMANALHISADEVIKAASDPTCEFVIGVPFGHRPADRVRVNSPVAVDKKGEPSLS
jgi:hypothetical protein